jgi:hypothetical protein
MVVVVIAVLLAGCGPDPKATVSGFYNALKKGDLVMAAGWLEGEVPPDALKPPDPRTETLLKSMFGRVEFTVDPKAEVEGDRATVKATVTMPDMMSIVVKAMSEALPLLLGAALGGQQDEAQVQALVEDLFVRAFADPEAPMVTETVALELHRVNGRWLIAQGQNPLSFLTGGLERLGDVFTP